MPWKERKALDERREFLKEWSRQEESLAELCRRYAISRPTAYKWIDRYECGGEAALEQQSRAPLHHPQAISASVADCVLQVRARHPRWGPRKIKAFLEGRERKLIIPAASSIGEMLRREGLSHPRVRRRRTPGCATPPREVGAPNDLWCTDFKGWFLCGNGQRCDPLTISDACSRFGLRCRAVEHTDGVRVRAVYEGVFRKNGMPWRIRSDNGPPFATRAPAGLSQLSIWWLHLGITHERIRPGHPEENGQQERLHETLKQETASPPAATLRQQQDRFRKFEFEYNHERPHEALGYRTPAEVYVPSPRTYPAKLPELEYPAGAILRQVSAPGQLKWRSEKVFISNVLQGEIVGLVEQEEEDFYEVYLGPLLLGWFDGTAAAFAPDSGPRRRRSRKSGVEE
jgi:transposase InsO family protein